MKTRHPFYCSCTVLVLAAAVFGQNVAAPPPPAASPTPTPPTTTEPQAPPETKLSNAQLDDLTGPIALYPDPLIAQILPAATFPTDIVLAGRMIKRGATQQEFDAQDWDPSVKSLTHYPSIIKMMDERLEWTSQLGAAFARQPDAVMDSIQRLRVKARALGNLRDTPEQQVVVEQPDAGTSVVKIVPASPSVVYVPTYEPDVVYVQPYTSAYIASPYVWFGTGFAIGAWLNLDCDWYGHRCYYPYGWSWCSYPYYGWGWGFGIGFSWCSSSHWHGGSGWCWDGGHHDGHWGHDSWHHDGGNGHGGWDGGHGRTNDAHLAAWSRNDSRPAPALRANQPVADWARRTGGTGGTGTGFQGSPSARADLSAGGKGSFQLPPTSQAGMGDTSRRFSSEGSFSRRMSPAQIQERLGQSGVASKPGVASVRAGASPRMSDRSVPNLGAKYGSRSTNTNADSLRRTRQLPAMGNTRTYYRGQSGSGMAVPGSNNVRGGSGVRVYTPSSRGSSMPAARSMPSMGSRSISSPSFSRGSMPSRSAAPAMRSAPTMRGGAPARGSSPGFRRGR